MFEKYENINYMIVTQDQVCNSILSLHLHGERSGKFSQNGKFGQNGKFSQNGTFGQKAMSGQKGKVHLGPNVSNFTHCRGCVVNGSNMSIMIDKRAVKRLFYLWYY